MNWFTKNDLLRIEQLSSAVNVLTNTAKISAITKLSLISYHFPTQFPQKS